MIKLTTILICCLCPLVLLNGCSSGPESTSTGDQPLQAKSGPASIAKKTAYRKIFAYVAKNNQSFCAFAYQENKFLSRKNYQDYCQNSFLCFAGFLDQSTASKFLNETFQAIRAGDFKSKDFFKQRFKRWGELYAVPRKQLLRCEKKNLNRLFKKFDLNPS
jgi:hypothetical protein